MEQMPSYVPHIMKRGAIDKLEETLGVSRNFLNMVDNPRTARDVIRRFHEKGRPLSIEEVAEEWRKGNVRGKLNVAEDYRKDPDVFKKLVDDEGLEEFVKRRKVSRHFDTDEHVALETLVRQTARSVSNAEYLNDAARAYGKRIKKVGKGKAAERAAKAQEAKLRHKGFVEISELPEGEAIASAMPHLKGMFFRREHLPLIAKSQARFLNPDAAGKVQRIYDAMQNWWISFTLPIYPAFHVRNAFGNFFNMVDAGFGSTPGTKDWANDMAALKKVTAMQMYNTAKNYDKLADPNLKFYIKALDREVDAMEFQQIALKNGISGAGWFGGTD